MDQDQNPRLKHDLFVCQNTGPMGLENEFQIGYAFKYPEKPYYVLKIWPIPNATYYLSKNRDSDGYTVFAKLVETDGADKLQNPVGYAQLNPHLKNFVEICLRLPKQRLYMSLYPSA